MSMAIIGLLLGISVLFVSGCSSTRRDTKLLYDGLTGSSGAYRKIMVALPFENDAPWVTADLNVSFARELRKVIESKGDGVTLLMPGDPGFPSRFSEPARLADGDLDGAALAAIGRDSGINLILVARLVDMRHIEEDRGMFWFETVAHLARIQMEIGIYHSGTGAEMLERTVFHNIDITEAEGDLIDADEMPEALPLQEALAEIADDMGSAANNVLKHIPWETYVTSVEGDRIILAAGEACGLKKGSMLKVFNVAEITVQETGQHLFSPGNEIGSITVTAVYPDRSEAVVKKGGPIPPGSVVRTR